MGKGGPKMGPFERFAHSVMVRAEQVMAAAAIDPRFVTEPDWRCLEDLFSSIEVMESEARLVGNSKVMAHMVPDIVPPIDREYTLYYLVLRRARQCQPSNKLRAPLRVRSVSRAFFNFGQVVSS
jgi:hypothetical protein